jgi:addiction module HigA family antidote
MTNFLPKSPGETLGDLIRESGLNQTEAATKLGITRQYLNGVVNAKYPVTAELRLKLSDLLKTKPEFWAEVQKNWDEHLSSPEGRAMKREKDQEELALNLDIRGGHTLVDHEIEAALKAGHLTIEPFDRERLNATCYQLGFGVRGFSYLAGSPEPRPVVTKPGFNFKRGQMLTISTRETLVLPGRVRAIVHGLTEMWSDKFVQCFHQRVIEPGMSGSVTFSLINSGPFDLEIMEGEPCLALSFEYLAQEPVASV